MLFQKLLLSYSFAFFSLPSSSLLLRPSIQQSEILIRFYQTRLDAISVKRLGVNNNNNNNSSCSNVAILNKPKRTELTVFGSIWFCQNMWKLTGNTLAHGEQGEAQVRCIGQLSLVVVGVVLRVGSSWVGLDWIWLDGQPSTWEWDTDWRFVLFFIARDSPIPTSRRFCDQNLLSFH